MKLKELLDILEDCLVSIYDGNEKSHYYSNEVPRTFADMTVTYAKAEDHRLYVEVED